MEYKDAVASHKIDIEHLKKTIDLFKEDAVLQDALIDSFDRLYQLDYYLIDNTNLIEQPRKEKGSKHYVGERAIVFRFAHYLQSFLEKSDMDQKLIVDCEYNRNLDKPKIMPNKTALIIPDLIIHKRNSNDQNILVMEFKGYWNKDNSHDRGKVEPMVSDEHEYRYKYGMLVTFGLDQPGIELFI